MFFRKNNQEIKRISKPTIGVVRGPRFGMILGYYCKNCYYGTRYQDQNKLHSTIKRCPECNIILDWDNIDLEA